MARTGQLCYGGVSQIIERGNMRKTYLKYFLEDVAWYTKMENMYQGVDRWSQKEYYKKLSDYSADFTRESHRGFVKIDHLNFTREEEKIIWKKVFSNSLCTKIQSFNLKVVHSALPTMEVLGVNKMCIYCKEVLNINIVETDIHILLECTVAKAVWQCVNERLRAAYLNTIIVNKSTIFYKIGVDKPQVHLISEVNWSLWRNRCSSVYDGTLNSHVSVLKSLFSRLSLISKVDRAILSIRVYNQRWLGINQAIDALDI